MWAYLTSLNLTSIQIWHVCLFPRLKSTLKGTRFQTLDKTNGNTVRKLVATSKEKFAGCIKKWKGLGDKYVRFDEEYFEVFKAAVT